LSYHNIYAGIDIASHSVCIGAGGMRCLHHIFSFRLAQASDDDGKRDGEVKAAAVRLFQANLRDNLDLLVLDGRMPLALISALQTVCSLQRR
jgi:hypothetical protein